MRITILDDYTQAVAKLTCFKLLKEHVVTILTKPYQSLDQLVEDINDPEALVLNRTCTPITEALLERLSTLKLISQTGKNTGHIDVDACTRHRVAIAEGKGNPIAPAELTWILIMNVLRQIPISLRNTQKGLWQTHIGSVVYGKRIGIWGYGKIGKRIAKYAQAFEANVVIWGSEASRNQAVADGYEAAKTKAEFFKTCDVISLHLRLHKSTRGIITRKDLLNMKQTATLVNTARSALIEKGALQHALKQGRPGYAALDVYDEEPIFNRDYPLLQADNVICTPHLGYVEKRSFELYYKIAFQNVLDFANSKPSNILNIKSF